MRGLMLALRGWAGSVIWAQLDGNDEYYTVPASLNVATPAEIGAAFITWALDGARVWAADVTDCSYTFAESAGRLRLVFALEGTFSSFDELEGSGGLAQTIFWPGSDYSEGLLGTVAADIDTYGWSRWDKSGGGIAGDGSAWINGATPVAARRPVVAFDLPPQQLLRWEAGLRYIPRANAYADVYHPASAAWRRVVLGQHSIDPDKGFSLVTVGLEVIG